MTRKKKKPATAFQVTESPKKGEKTKHGKREKGKKVEQGEHQAFDKNTRVIKQNK